MAHIKMLARHAMIGATFVGMFSAMTLVAYEAAGAAMTVTSYLAPHR